MPDIVFDIIGTCIGYDVMIDAITHKIGNKLNKFNCNPELFFNAWGTACERDFAYLSQIGHYHPTRKILKSIFFRTLYQAGIDEPKDVVSEEDLEYLCDEWLKLTCRPELPALWKMLRENGFTIWCLTDGDAERVKGYFKNSNLTMPDENIVSCDSLGIGKPTPEVYTYMLDKLPNKGKDAWFGAAHMWDCCAAKKAGFRTAWTNVYEKYPCEDIFGSPDIIAGDLLDLGQKLITAQQSL
jgi:2-haloacid dehalogenase